MKMNDHQHFYSEERRQHLTRANRCRQGNGISQNKVPHLPGAPRHFGPDRCV